MSETLEDRKEFYEKLMAYPTNYKETLKQMSGFDDVKFEKYYNQAGSVGFIKKGVDGTFKSRYQVTSFGKEQISSFLRVYYM